MYNQRQRNNGINWCMQLGYQFNGGAQDSGNEANLEHAFDILFEEVLKRENAVLTTMDN